MGLTIFYKGKLKAKECLNDLVEEITEIAESHEWQYHVFKTDLAFSDFTSDKFDDEIYGILAMPPGCEPLCFTFLSNGNICSPFALGYYLKTKDKSLLNEVFVKTQYAGPYIHRLIIHLMEYISKKYFGDFELIDETDYWIHRDEKLLTKKFEEMTAILNFVGENLKSAKSASVEDLEDHFRKLIGNFKFRKPRE